MSNPNTAYGPAYLAGADTAYAEAYASGAATSRPEMWAVDKDLPVRGIDLTVSVALVENIHAPAESGADEPAGRFPGHYSWDASFTADPEAATSAFARALADQADQDVYGGRYEVLPTQVEEASAGVNGLRVIQLNNNGEKL